MDVVVRALSDVIGDLTAYADHYGRLGTPRSLEQVRWQFLQPLPGCFWVEVATADIDGDPGRVVATYGSQPLRFRVDGEVVRGFQAVDASTDERFRGRGLFGQMAATVAERAARDGARLVFGFPAGGTSTRGHFGRIGWTSLDPVPFLIRPLRTGYFSRRLLGDRVPLPSIPVPVRGVRLRAGHEIREFERFDTRFDALWRSFSQRVGVAVERDAAYLNWRIVDKPGETYRRAAYFENGRLIGFVAWVLRMGKHGGNVGYVLEMFTEPGRNDAGRRLLRHALLDMQRAGGDVVLAWNFAHSPNHAAHLGVGFLPFPERLRPIELHLGARTLGDGPSASVTERAAWYLSYCDSDTV